MGILKIWAVFILAVASTVVSASIMEAHQKVESTPTLDGYWKSNCATTGEYSYMGRLIFKKNQFEAITIHYENPKCEFTDNTFKVTYKGQFKTHVPFGGSIDLEVESLTVFLLSHAAVDHFNENSMCGISNWERLVYVDIMGAKDCAGLSPPQKGDIIYESFRINDDKKSMSFATYPMGPYINDSRFRPVLFAKGTAKFYRRPTMKK